MLKLLKLRKQKKEKEIELKKIREKIADFQKREEELNGSLEEAETDEDVALVEENIEKLGAEKEEAGDLEGTAANLEKEIEEIDSEIEECERKVEEAKRAKETDPAEKKAEQRGEKEMVLKRRYEDFTLTERQALVEREDVKGFLTNVRSLLGSQSRAVNGTDFTIPDVMVDLLRPDILENSKLLKHVHLKPVKGKAREEVLGLPPEGIWMEMDEALQSLDFAFYLANIDGYKVGGYIPIPNYLLQDSDVALMNEIMRYLGAAIAIAIDKAIVKGSGTKQPLGIMTRLAQTSKPADYSSKMPEWKDLHNSNIIEASSASLTGQQLFAEMIEAFGNCNNKYAQNTEKVYVMSEKTKSKLMAKLVVFDSSGTIVSSLDNKMPILGGTIETEEFMADGEILGGYFKPYLMAEREGNSIASSEHVKFIDDQTVVRGYARYDGMPVIADSWVVFKLASGESE